jgi:hypothetical protein
MELDCRMTDELERIQKEAIMTWLGHYPAICLEQLTTTMKDSSQGGWHEGHDLNSVLPEYKSTSFRLPQHVWIYSRVL